MIKIAVVDDQEYWRSQIPVWLSDPNFQVDSFEDYGSFEGALIRGCRYRYVLGDFAMRDRRESGIESLKGIYSRFPDSLGKVYIFTVFSKSDLKRRCRELNIEMNFEYLSKEKVMDFIEELKCRERHE